jgi:beta-galactosidase
VEARRRTWFDDRGLVIRGAGDATRTLPFYAGAMHYWRVEPSRWTACLSAIHAQGLTVVETYVPWRVHEPERGQFEWTGAADLGRWLDEARAAGLSVVLRPGPHVNAELTSFGMPDWVLAEPACQSRSSRGTPVWMPQPPRAWPLPSYASAAFHAHVRDWYAAVAAVVAPHLAPDGPVVAIGVDNEAQMFFRLGAYDHDYHPDAIAWWRDAAGYEDPPRVWADDDAARCVAWIRFKDEYIARALGELAASLDAVGLGEIARFHNLPPGHHAHYDLRGIQRAIGGPVGIDAYTPRAEFRELRRRAAALVGNASPIPIAFEVGVGFFPWFPPLDEHDDPHRERDQLLALLASGVRGFNLFMVVERERYYGAAIDRHGKLENHAQWIRPLVRTLAALDWLALRRTTPIALVDTKADLRFGLASCLIDPMSAVVADVLDLGPGGAAELGTDAGAIAMRAWQRAICAGLELAQVPYAIVDETAGEDELARYRAVIVPTGDRVDRALWQRLHALADARRTVVVIGPGTPTHDEHGKTLDAPAPKRIGRIREGSLDDVPGLAADLAALAGDASEHWQIERPDDVRAMAFGGDTAKVVFVASDDARPTTAVLLADDTAKSLRDPFTHEVLNVVDGRVSVRLEARGVRMLVVE